MLRTNLLWMTAGIAIGIVFSQVLLMPAAVTVQAPGTSESSPTPSPMSATFDAPQEAAFALQMPKMQTPQPSTDTRKRDSVQEQVKTLVAQGKVAAAQAQLQAALKESPDDPTLNLEMADFYLGVVQDSGKALPFLERSLANTEKTGEEMVPALQSLVDLASGSPDSSVRELAGKAVHENAARDDSASAQLALGRVQNANGDAQGALKSLDAAAGKGSVAAAHERAGILMSQRDYPGAEAAMSQAYQMGRAREARARANGESGEQYKRENDILQMDLGTVQIANGHVKAGIGNLTEYLKENPNDQGAQAALEDGKSRAEGEVGEPKVRR